jgi:hypothetical protein
MFHSAYSLSNVAFNQSQDFSSCWAFDYFASETGCGTEMNQLFVVVGFRCKRLRYICPQWAKRGLPDQAKTG